MKINKIIDVILEDARLEGAGIYIDDEISISYSLDEILTHLKHGGKVIITGVSEYDEGDIELTKHTPQEASDYPYQPGRSWIDFILDEGNYGGDSKKVSIHPNKKEETGLYVTYETVESTGLDEDEYPDCFQSGYRVEDIFKDDWDDIIISVVEDIPRHMIH